jgi:4'-phosphopantetheinyl transferase EntD
MLDPSRISMSQTLEDIRGLFTAPVELELAAAGSYFASLPEVEARAVANAAPQRRQEFTAGRTTARLALHKLGASPTPIPVAPSRAPVWPADVVGTITHCDGFCAAAVAWRKDAIGIGLDAEPQTPLDPALYPLIFDFTELAGFERLSAPTRPLASKIGFCAKEALYKSLAETDIGFLNFDAVRISLTETTPGLCGSFSAEPEGDLPIIRRIAGRWLTKHGLVAAAATI